MSVLPVLFVSLCIFWNIFTIRCQAGQEPTEVAFSVGVTGMKRVAGGHKLVYDRIFTNIGSGYNSATGVFTCPLSGLYVFQLHALAQNDSNVWLEMYHNYHYVISIFGHTANDDASAGNSVILQVTKGDEVSVSSGPGWTSLLYGDASEVYTTFSGYLISPVYQEIPGLVGRR